MSDTQPQSRARVAEMTSFERVAQTLARRPVDQSPVVVSPWTSTIARWVAEGHITAETDVHAFFGQDLYWAGHINCIANLDMEPIVLEETEETRLVQDGNGAILRRHKLHESTPEHVDFLVRDRDGWEAHIKPFLLEVDRRRISFDDYRTVKRRCADGQRFFCWGGLAPFEQMHPVCGHEYMLMGMALDPEWVQDMVMTYVEMTIRHAETLFAEEGVPDGMYFFEDMGFKQRPFMSPAMYEEIMLPGHQRLFDFAHAHGCKVLMHSCGFIEPLLPGVIRAGLDCLQGMEVKAGMDLPTLFRDYGTHLSFFGGVDARVLISNDRAQIDAELESKVRPVLQGGGGYILHSDHSEPPEVDFATVQYFVDRGRAMSRGEA
ncbi:MAG TPA: uroporphyrinogen decarboxylase family protein [Armatimonadota bacterium]|jgi:uroporphyrinogen decarboxylase